MFLQHIFSFKAIALHLFSQFQNGKTNTWVLKIFLKIFSKIFLKIFSKIFEKNQKHFFEKKYLQKIFLIPECYTILES